jgi:S1-C subfamily serine protease
MTIFKQQPNGRQYPIKISFVSLFLFQIINYGSFSQSVDLFTQDFVKKTIGQNIMAGKYSSIEGIWEERVNVKLSVHGTPLNTGTGPTSTIGIINKDFEFQSRQLDKKEGYAPTIFLFTDQKRFNVIVSTTNGSQHYGTGTLIDFNNVKYTVVFGQGTFEYSLRKVWPTYKEIEQIKEIAIKYSPRSGTCFAIASDGTIATNYHLIEGANSIKIRGVNGDFSKSFIATVIHEDKLNDLAILKITDDQFKSLGIIPYKLMSTTNEVGEDIFVLGYPLTSTMGDEIKLTTGVISSRTGYQGSVSHYQISAPIQPGNSGGPLFDKAGNLIGVINSKHTNADNVGYAIKGSYLKALIELLNSKPSFTSSATLANKPLSAQVKSIKQFIYIVEVNHE